MLDRISGMQVFARTAALGSLSAAARDLGMSQTMATKHMAATEARLGARLLHRSTRRMTLTEAGRIYLDAVERILEDVAETEAAIQAEATTVRGLLRLNAPVSFGVREIAPRLPELARRHPELRVDLGLNDRQVDPIEEGWDMVVRIGALKDADLVARRLAPCRIVVCASPAYLAARGTPRTAADLADHDCLGYTIVADSDTWRFGPGGRHRQKIRGPLQANNGAALSAAAMDGLGIIYQPTYLVADDIVAGRLKTIDLDPPPTPLDGVFAVYPSNRRPPAKVRATIDFLAESFGSTPAWDAMLDAAAR